MSKSLLQLLLAQHQLRPLPQCLYLKCPSFQLHGPLQCRLLVTRRWLLRHRHRF
uniref:Uncharacterized protein n=1 Tax=Arundo donax TaxID=35708 RepID=A0A0A8Y3I0_ARUDO